VLTKAMNNPTGGGGTGGGKAVYVAKHAFVGQSAQSQLSFVPNSRIVASTNQNGAWWWGNCDGKVSDTMTACRGVLNNPSHPHPAEMVGYQLPPRPASSDA
jgi:hypothetical protein